MAKPKKRKAYRISERDPEGELNLPVRKTKELYEQHKASVDKKSAIQSDFKTIGENEEGKELFEYIFKAMASPGTQSD